MVGIYKITTPSGAAYIGQSWDIKRRWTAHKCFQHSTMAIGHSLRKYGPDAHIFEVVHQLPEDTTQLILDTYEGVYLNQYQDSGVIMLNVKEAGSTGKHSPETRKILCEKRKNYKPTQETKLKTSLSMKGMRANNKGVPHSEEHRKKISLSNMGRKASPKMIELLIERNKSRKGIPGWNKGKTWSEEHKKRLSEAHKGKKLSQESIYKRNMTRYGRPPKTCSAANHLY